MFFYNETDSEISQQPGVSDPHFSNVSLLLKMDTDFSDSSTYNHSATVSGNTTISSTESKYGGASGYFDGSGDYVRYAHDASLNLNDATDFTVEVWVYHTGDYSFYRPILSKRTFQAGVQWQFYLNISSGDLRFWNGAHNSFGTTVPANQWVHLAFVGTDGNTITAYMDGVSVGSISTWANAGSDDLLVGHVLNSPTEFWSGYIDDVRITKGVARYTDSFTPPSAHTTTEQYYNNVSLLLSLDSDFSDSSINNISVTTVGNTAISSTESKYGGASAYLDGSGDGIVVTDNNFANFGTDDFTIEAWVNMASDSTQGPIFEARSAQAYELIWYIDPATNKLGFIPNNHGVTRITSVNTISRNTWHHLVVSRENGIVSFFIDGIKDAATANYANSIYQTRTDVRIGQVVDNGFTAGFKGYIDDLRVTKGVARYTANFTPPDSHPTS